MNDPVLRLQEKGGVLTLLLNRPQKRNALNRELVGSLADALNEAREMEAVKVILIRGAGSDFCAGADLAELEAVLDQPAEAGLADARRLGALLLSMRRHPKPILAVVHGRALAGGCGLASACDMVLAREDSEFGYPEVFLGFVPAMVMAILRRKLPEGRAFELVATGRRVSAEEGRAMGLVNHVFPAADFESRVEAFATELASRPASALALIKSLLYEQGDLSMAEGIERGARVNVQARQTEACREGVRAVLEGKRGGRK